MTNLDQGTPRGRSFGLIDLVNRPLTSFQCVIGWIVSTIIFFGLSFALGGPSEGDASESAFTTWAIQHGRFACSYFHLTGATWAHPLRPDALMAPLYPVLAGALAAIVRIGHGTPFPTTAQMGPHCANAVAAMAHWQYFSAAITPTINLSYLMWPLLLASIIVLVRASGRGRTSWEVVAAVMAGCSPLVFDSFIGFFHPEDILAMCLIMFGLSAAINRRWLLVGVCLGLAFTAQQFALLAAVPLFFAIPRKGRVKYSLWFVVAMAVIDLPLVVSTSGRALHVVLFGSSRAGSNVHSFGGTVLWELNLHGVPLFLLSRAAPIIAAGFVAWWCARRLGPHLIEPVPLLSLIGTCLAFRLVFEINLFSYYFMAAGVMLVMLDVAMGRIRGQTFAWLGLTTIAFNPVHWGFFSNITTWSGTLYRAVPFTLIGVGTLAILVDVTRRRFHFYKWLWLVIVIVTVRPVPFGGYAAIIHMPNWAWQLILTPTVLYLLASPLSALIHAQERMTSPATSIAANQY